MSTTALTSENQKQGSSSQNYLYISAPGSAPRAMATQLKRWQKTHPENFSSQEALLLHSLWHSPRGIFVHLRVLELSFKSKQVIYCISEK